MPVDNNFQHSKYSRADPGERVSYLEFEPGAPYDSPAWQDALSKAGAQLARAGVQVVLFINSLPYSDLFGAARLDEAGGLKRGYSRGIPGLESLLGLLRPETNGLAEKGELLKPPVENNEVTNRKLDDIAGDIGNFTQDYIEAFAKVINTHGAERIYIDRYLWSSMNHHLGRVNAALNVLEYLDGCRERLSLQPEHRVLVLAAGHAGQVLALISNFLSPVEASNREAIFQLLAGNCERMQKGDDSLARLDRLYRRLTTSSILNGAMLDVVTLGTPVRYGWDPSALGKLLHIVNHRSVRGDGKRWLAKMDLPQIAWEIPMIAGGDYIQQLAVAGTDAVPGSEEEQFVNQELREVLEPYDGFERWLECARRGTRCANDGQCLLVDYKVTGDVPSPEHLFGHACYTRNNAMLFNTLQIVNRLYPS